MNLLELFIYSPTQILVTRRTNGNDSRYSTAETKMKIIYVFPENYF